MADCLYEYFFFNEKCKLLKSIACFSRSQISGLISFWYGFIVRNHNGQGKITLVVNTYTWNFCTGMTCYIEKLKDNTVKIHAV